MKRTISILLLYGTIALAGDPDATPIPALMRLHENLMPVLQSVGTTNVQLFSNCIWIEYNTTNKLNDSTQEQVVPLPKGFSLIAIDLGRDVNPKRQWTEPTTDKEHYGTRWNLMFQIPSSHLVSVHLRYGSQMDTNVISTIQRTIETLAKDTAVQSVLIDINERVFTERLSTLGFDSRVSGEIDVRNRFSLVCMGFFDSRKRWPGSLQELKEFWAFAPSEPSHHLWTTFQYATLSIQDNGALSVQTPDGIKLHITYKPKPTTGKRTGTNLGLIDGGFRQVSPEEFILETQPRGDVSELLKQDRPLVDDRK